jgi:hypothetical protein
MFRALKPVIAVWIGIAFYGVTSGDWSLAAGGAFMTATFAGLYYFGHTRDPQRRW